MVKLQDLAALTASILVIVLIVYLARQPLVGPIYIRTPKKEGMRGSFAPLDYSQPTDEIISEYKALPPSIRTQVKKIDINIRYIKNKMHTANREQIQRYRQTLDQLQKRKTDLLQKGLSK